MNGRFSVEQFCTLQRVNSAIARAAERDDPPLLVTRPRLWAFGADVPETKAIRDLLRSAGEAFVDIVDGENKRPQTPSVARTCIGLRRVVQVTEAAQQGLTVFLIGVADTEPQKWWQRLLRRKVSPPRIIDFGCPWVHLERVDEARKILVAAGVRFHGWHRWKREQQAAAPTLH